MGRFAHMADIHLGAHREPVLRELELKCFNGAMDTCLEREVDFILVSGDLFHVGIPDLGVVNTAVRKIREIHEAGVRIFAIYGSHDYNPASTSVIDIIETAGLLTNIGRVREDGGKFRLGIIEEEKTGAKLVGLSARKIGLESKYYEMLDRESLERERGFKIFAFHSGIIEFKPPHLSETETIPIKYLPKGFQYYAGGHIHERGEFRYAGYDRVVFPGPLFTGYGKDIEATAKGQKRGFYLVSFDDNVKSVEFVETESFKGAFLEYDATGKNSLEAGKELQSELKGMNVKGKVVALRVAGELSGGKTSDINFPDLRAGLIERGALYVYLNRYALTSREYTTIKFVGEDTRAVEDRSFRERIHDVSVSQINLKGESGISTALELLKVTRRDVKADESKKAHQDTIIKDGIEVLKLKKVVDEKER